MNEEENTTPPAPDAGRSLGYWLRVVGMRLGRELAHGAGRDDIRSRVENAVSPEDYATTVASLEAIARELGWDETAGDDFGWRGMGRGPRFARGFGRGFGRGSEADGPCHPHHHGAHHDERRHHGHHRHHRGDHRKGQRAYERGFDAGFQRGRDTAA